MTWSWMSSATKISALNEVHIIRKTFLTHKNGIVQQGVGESPNPFLPCSSSPTGTQLLGNNGVPSDNTCECIAGRGRRKSKEDKRKARRKNLLWVKKYLKKKILTKPIDRTLKKNSLKTTRSVRPTYLKVRKKNIAKESYVCFNNFQFQNF